MSLESRLQYFFRQQAAAEGLIPSVDSTLEHHTANSNLGVGQILPSLLSPSGTLLPFYHINYLPKISVFHYYMSASMLFVTSEFFLNYTKLATMAMKAYVGKSQINSEKKLFCSSLRKPLLPTLPTLYN